MANYVGKQTLKFNNKPSILNTASVVGDKEGKGPLAKYFDETLTDPMYGEQSWEKAESKILKHTIDTLIKKADIKEGDINAVFAGDLLNQITASVFAVKDSKIPFFGLYGACSTMAESMILGSMMVDGDYAQHVIAAASSHFCSAEKQFRAPLEQGGQRPPTATWTVTGAGASLIGKGGGPYITYGTIGKIIDFEIKDAFNMGAVMAPAAADVIINHLLDTGRDESYYDLIITGDLGQVGKNLLCEMLTKYGYNMNERISDCGVEIFDLNNQDVGSGGSGCGCSASVFSGYLYDGLLNGTWNKILFVPTGAMLSTLSIQQGETIPGIAYAVAIEKEVD